ncbi:MAG: hypothetical protein MJ003_07640 [Paludibacteraceae bacterium]|nr:hypothetical protein [Paludibacteraceae bacterium]
MRKIRLIILFLTISFGGFASNLSRGFYEPSVSFEFMPEYSYNIQWKSMANFDLKSTFAKTPYFEFTTALQFSTLNVHTVDFRLKPRLPLPIGELFLDFEPYYRIDVKDRIHDAAIAASVGYRFDYLSFQVGWFGRFLVPFDGGGYHKELANILYGVEVFCRPQYSNWNISLRMSNFNDYQIERWSEPLFMLSARYDLFDMMRLSAGVECKPVGIGNVQAQFFGITARIGIGLILE